VVLRIAVHGSRPFSLQVFSFRITGGSGHVWKTGRPEGSLQVTIWKGIDKLMTTMMLAMADGGQKTISTGNGNVPAIDRRPSNPSARFRRARVPGRHENKSISFHRDKGFFPAAPYAEGKIPISGHATGGRPNVG